jgi:tRNA-dependent cyclodipeptide synthase
MSDSNFDKNDVPSVSVVRITPQITDEKLSTYRECYMGISLDNPVFRGKSLAAMLAWALERFDSCLVVTGDYLRRHNERVMGGLNGEEAGQAALRAGDEFIDREKELFSRLPAERVRLIRWKECLAFAEYESSKAALDKLFAADASFREAVQKDAVSFVARQLRKNGNLATSEEEAIAVSCEYLLEEIAVFSALSQRGRHVELYPGAELEVLVKIANGEFSDIPAGLKERINVELKCNSNKAQTQ